MAMCYLKFIMSRTEKSLIKCPGEPGPATRCPRHSPRLPAGLCVMCPFSLLSRIHRVPFCVSRLRSPSCRGYAVWKQGDRLGDRIPKSQCGQPVCSQWPSAHASLPEAPLCPLLKWEKQRLVARKAHPRQLPALSASRGACVKQNLILLSYSFH